MPLANHNNERTVTFSAFSHEWVLVVRFPLYYMMKTVIQSVLIKIVAHVFNLYEISLWLCDDWTSSKGFVLKLINRSYSTQAFTLSNSPMTWHSHKSTEWKDCVHFSRGVCSLGWSSLFLPEQEGRSHQPRILDRCPVVSQLFGREGRVKAEPGAGRVVRSSGSNKLPNVTNSVSLLEGRETCTDRTYFEKSILKSKMEDFQFSIRK